MVWPDSIGDWVFFILRLRWHIVLLSAIALLTLLAFILAGRYLHPQYSRPIWWLPPIAISVVLIVSIGVNVRSAILLTLLGSENDALAERAYLQFAQISCIDKIVLLIQDEREPDNVRFYLSRILGERLQGSSPEVLSYRLDQIRSAPLISPAFIATNAVNIKAKQILRNKHSADVVQYYAGITPQESSIESERFFKAKKNQDGTADGSE